MQYYNHLEYYRRMTSYRIGAMQKRLCRRAARMIELMAKEYKLK